MGAPEPDGSNLPPTAADSTPAPPPKADLYASSSTPGGPAMRSRSKSRSVRRRTDQEPISPIESESEYGGLAYADSTDYEDGDNDDDFNSRRSNSIGRRRKSRTPPPPLPVPVSASAAILQRSRSKASRHMQFGSVSVRSRSRSNDRGDIRIGGSGPMSISMKSGTSGHSRENSMHSHSSYSSDNDAADLEGRNRSRANSSAAIAHALGLSQTPPSEYAKLGGPGILGRSVSGSSSNGGGGGSKSGYSRGSAQNNNGNGERSMAALLQDANTTDAEAKARFGGLPGGPAGGPLKSSASVSSKSSASASSAGKQRSFGSSVDSGRGVTSSALRRLDTAAANSHRDDFNEDDGDSVLGGMGGSKAQRSKTVQGMQSPDAAKKPIKLPTRSLTSPSPKVESYKSLAADGGVVKKERPRRPRTCLRCSKVIEDGRWVSVDGGGVLCERCWKNMYLPKCRRCNLPIEKQAVSSSDGQLKGKYHKECFNCHTCHKPFPDKTFYVYDGKPLCAYHYHEANDSLCAAARCGQPIEGPCAVSYSGDRYHPEHMTCEYPGYPECRERLKEYWEVDGRMLCERHAHYATRSSSDEEGEEQWVKSSKAMKRVTRFIDLAGAGGIGAGGSDLR
ncbi:hypothetical protein BDZ97DRAFT_1794695 [Flammula alnicola]|nr:hypothetical protein BDZ97DRAFT_1794695 [Flammula alnicola]